MCPAGKRVSRRPERRAGLTREDFEPIETPPLPMKKIIPTTLALLIAVGMSPLHAAKNAGGKSADKSAAAPGVAAELPTEPGAHKRLPCAKDPKLTFDLYLPKAYAEPAKPGDRGFPALFLSAPHKNPGFRGLEKWAERNGVILVTFNDSENGPTDAVIKVQDAVLGSVTGLRIHPTLRFASGFSGAGVASMVLASRKPREFAGIVVHCHSLAPKLPKTTAIAYLARYQDEFLGYVGFLGAADEERGEGNYVHESFSPGGHDWAPRENFERALDAQLLYARLVNPGLNDSERKEYAKLPDKLLETDGKDPRTIVDSLAGLVEPEAFKGRPFRARAVEAWCLARAGMIDREPDSRKAFEQFVEHATAKAFAECGGVALKSVAALRKKLEADPALKKEFPAWKDFLKLRAQYTQVAKKFDAKRYDAVMKGFAKLAKDSPDTFAGKLAKYANPKG